NGAEVFTVLRRPAWCDVECLFAFNHLRQGLAADGAVDDVVDVRDVDAPAGAFLAVHAKLEVRLAHDAVDADAVADAANSLQPALHLIRQLLEPSQVGTEDLHGVIALYAGQRLHDVVANVGREIPIDADELAVELGVQIGDQLGLG